MCWALAAPACRGLRATRHAPPVLPPARRLLSDELLSQPLPGEATAQLRSLLHAAVGLLAAAAAALVPVPPGRAEGLSLASEAASCQVGGGRGAGACWLVS
jgi:hypothetical protein